MSMLLIVSKDSDYVRLFSRECESTLYMSDNCVKYMPFSLAVSVCRHAVDSGQGRIPPVTSPEIRPIRRV